MIHLTHFMAPLVPLVWARRRWQSPTAAAAVERDLQVPPFLNAGLLRMLSLERRWLASGRKLPAGTSIAAVAVAR